MTAAALALWFRAFVFTQLVEAPIYRRVLGASWGRALVPSALTHPLVWFAFPPLGRALGIGYVATVVLAELFAWLGEAVFLAKTAPRAPLRTAVVASLVANGASLGLGLACRAVFGVP